MTPAQKLQDVLSKELSPSVVYEQDDNILFVNCVEENVRIKLRIWEIGGRLVAQLRHARCHMPEELPELIAKINEYIQSEIKKRGSHEEDIAKKSRSIVPNNVAVRRDGNTIGFFVNQSKAIEVAELLKKFFLGK